MEAHILQTSSSEPGLGLGRWNDEKQIFISWIWGPLLFTHFPYNQTEKASSFFFELRKCQTHFTVAFCPLLDAAKTPFIFVLSLVKVSSSGKMRGAYGERWKWANVQDWASLMHAVRLLSGTESAGELAVMLPTAPAALLAPTSNAGQLSSPKACCLLRWQGDSWGELLVSTSKNRRSWSSRAIPILKKSLNV